MADEHPNTIPKTESDELMKSSVENLVPIPSESKDISDDECELPLCDDSPETQFTTFSNPLFDSNDDFSSSDDESFSEEETEENSISNEVLDEINSIPPRMNDCFNAESDLIESLLNQDTSIDSFHEIDSLFDEFADKLILLKPISPEIDNSDFDPEGEIRLIKRLLYDNSSPRPPEDLSIESFSPSPIPVEDSDSFMEEIDIFLASDDSTPPGVESDYDSEGDILFLEELLNNNLVPLSKYNHFTFDVEPDTTVKNDFDELNKDECFDPGGFLLYFSPPGVKTPFLTPASPLRAGGISSGWNFHIVTTSRYVVPTGRVKVPAGRYVVPTGKDNVIVSAGRTKVIPAGSTILVLVVLCLLRVDSKVS
ncbi:hypothetical protein Tco_0020057 [Tanacetum coccineum]